jgi:hypothetical protein
VRYQGTSNRGQIMQDTRWTRHLIRLVEGCG